MDKGKIFRELHASTFVIPNPWDIGTTKLLAALGFKALATTSAGYAFSRGGAVASRVCMHNLNALIDAQACLRA